MKKLNLKNLEPRVLVIPEMKLVAKGMTMSFAADRTFDLWRSFGPLIKDIPYKTGKEKYSIQIFPDADFFKNYDSKNLLKKYAAVNVSDYGDIPDRLEMLAIPKGLYAVFDYIGKPSESVETYRYILTQWIPHSQYSLDDRPHIAKMGEKYKGEQFDSEEELFIPIK